jgi:hypothetical protein
MTTISLPADVAAIALDLADAMSTPMSTETVVECIQRAKFLVPAFEEAFALAGIDPDDYERAEMPPLLQLPE